MFELGYVPATVKLVVTRMAINGQFVRDVAEILGLYYQ
jgi:hypothetical protein